MSYWECCTLWVWQWNIEYIEFDRHGSKFFYGGGGLFHPYLLINNLFSAETKFPTVSKILPPILNISPNGQKVNPCVYGGMDGEKLQQTGLFFVFYIFLHFLHFYIIPH